MTVHAAAADGPRAAGLNRDVVIDRRRVARADVAALAKHRHLRDEHPLVGRPMRVVARDAAFPSRCMLEQEGPALLGVARDTAFVYPVPHPELADVGRAMRVMARRAR